MNKNKTIKKDVKKVKKKKDLDSKVIKKLNKRISCLETENKKKQRTVTFIGRRQYNHS